MWIWQMLLFLFQNSSKSMTLLNRVSDTNYENFPYQNYENGLCIAWFPGKWDTHANGCHPRNFKIWIKKFRIGFLAWESQRIGYIFWYPQNQHISLNHFRFLEVIKSRPQKTGLKTGLERVKNHFLSLLESSRAARLIYVSAYPGLGYSKPGQSRYGVKSGFCCQSR